MWPRAPGRGRRPVASKRRGEAAELPRASKKKGESPQPGVPLMIRVPGRGTQAEARWQGAVLGAKLDNPH